MKLLSKIIFFLGTLMLVGGVVGAGIIYRDMKTENLMHARSGIVSLELTRISGWKTSPFAPYRVGTLLLCVTFDSAKPAPASAPEIQIEYSIREPGGRTVIHGTWPGRMPEQSTSNSWIAIDSVNIPDQTEASWSVGARVVKPDPSSVHPRAEVFVMPPQKYEIGSYLSGEMSKLVAMGILVILGFVLIVGGASMKRRTSEPSATPQG